MYATSSEILLVPEVAIEHRIKLTTVHNRARSIPSVEMDQICTEKFYGGRIQKQSPSRTTNWVKMYRSMPLHILGPTQYWEEFYKQADALTAAAEHSTKTDTLCTFVYQQPNDGTRRFVVAHPEVYWWHYKIKPPEERCSYEVSTLTNNSALHSQKRNT